MFVFVCERGELGIERQEIERKAGQREEESVRESIGI